MCWVPATTGNKSNKNNKNNNTNSSSNERLFAGVVALDATHPRTPFCQTVALKPLLGFLFIGVSGVNTTPSTLCCANIVRVCPQPAYRRRRLAGLAPAPLVRVGVQSVHLRGCVAEFLGEAVI